LIVVVGCGAVSTTKTTRESAVFLADTVLIIAAGMAFAFALLGWLAGHRISLALPPEVAPRAMVPLLVGVAGLFLGGGVGLLLGELKNVSTETTDGNEGPPRRVWVLKTVTPARVILGVGVLLLLTTAWMVKPASTVQQVRIEAPPAVGETGAVSPTVLPPAPTPTR
jgi:hypothetical protein